MKRLSCQPGMPELGEALMVRRPKEKRCRHDIEFVAGFAQQRQSGGIRGLSI